jgi:hypothetical protein
MVAEAGLCHPFFKQKIHPLTHSMFCCVHSTVIISCNIQHLWLNCASNSSRNILSRDCYSLVCAQVSTERILDPIFSFALMLSHSLVYNIVQVENCFMEEKVLCVCYSWEEFPAFIYGMELKLCRVAGARKTQIHRKVNIQCIIVMCLVVIVSCQSMLLFCECVCASADAREEKGCL